jgi:hypothetical protein
LKRVIYILNAVHWSLHLKSGATASPPGGATLPQKVINVSGERRFHHAKTCLPAGAGREKHQKKIS